jgi:myo-inositol-1(or 4)-monophosphatase
VSGAEAELLAIARAAARASAGELVARFGGRAEAVETKSSPTDLVSEADRAAERAIRALLAERRPDDGVLGEEGGELAGTSGVRWVVDPLDGTTNYLFGIPHWAVSVACEDRDGAVAGVVLDPLRDEEWAATRGGRFLLNGEEQPARGAPPPLGEALVATGFGYEAAVRERQATVAGRVLPRVRDLRRGGSATLDLAWTAAGRLDAYYERGPQPWDEAAGALLCRCAGLEIHRLEASDDGPSGLVAAPAELAGALLDLVSRVTP